MNDEFDNCVRIEITRQKKHKAIGLERYTHEFLRGTGSREIYNEPPKVEYLEIVSSGFKSDHLYE